MSYSVNIPCYGCEFEKRCLDGKKIQEAANEIHSTPYQPETGEGHFGGGTIVLACVHRNEPAPKDEESVDAASGD